MEKKYTPVEAAQLLLKSLSEKIAKADPALQHILADIKDKDAKAEVPKEMVPENSAQNVLNKTGMQKPMEPQKAPQMPKIGEAPKNNVPANINQMSIKQEQPSQGKGMGMAKKPLKLSEFMQKKEAKRQSVHGTPGINRDTHSRGVADTVSVSMHGHDGDAKEKSLAGLAVRRGDTEKAKAAHKETIEEMRSMPKPNLPKSEE